MKENDGLGIIDIANFCLLVNKYKTYIEQEGMTEQDNKEMLQRCSDSISHLLKIMDDCQKALYTTEYDEANICLMKEFESMFREGVEAMKQILDGFSVVTEGFC